MNRLFLLLSALFLTLSTQLFAADEETPCIKSGTSAVANALAEVDFLKGKPDPNAKYYIYLHSASWCGPCRREMPGIVDSYKELKKNGFEIILFGHDRTDREVVAYAENYNAEFPVLKDSSKLATKVPGYKAVNGIPHIVVVDRNGNEIVETHPMLFFSNDQWKNYISKDSQEGACAGQSSSCAGQSSSRTLAKSTVANALAKIRYLKGKPELKAKYYIYLHSAAWCGACCLEMPSIVSSYAELKEQGFEIILFGHDVSEGDVVAFAERFKAEFPVLKDSPEWATKVPGYQKVCGIPHMIIVNPSGKVIAETHPARFFRNDQWKSFISEDGSCSGGQGTFYIPAKKK